jgi:DNA end-binding protein Ku
MAGQLIADMTLPWRPENYTDQFAEAVNALVNDKLAAGQTHTVQAIEGGGSSAEMSNVVDLTQLLADSLLKRKAPAVAAPRSGVAVKKPKAGAARK